MRVLVACEYSGRVRQAFRALGHEAWSCDLLPADDGSPFHLMGDAICAAAQGMGLREPWDMLIAHPPCTHLAVSGAGHFAEKRADGRQQAAIDFFLKLAHADIPRIAIENPVCIMSSVWREPDQIIQPWQFGHGETKATCLWLKGLPPPFCRPTSSPAESSASGRCRRGRIAGRNAASPTKASPPRWRSSGAITPTS